VEWKRQWRCREGNLDCVVHQERVVKRWLLGDVHAVDDVSVRTLLIFFLRIFSWCISYYQKKKSIGFRAETPGIVEKKGITPSQTDDATFRRYS
jgi:hypothetical protein